MQCTRGKVVTDGRTDVCNCSPLCPRPSIPVRSARISRYFLTRVPVTRLIETVTPSGVHRPTPLNPPPVCNVADCALQTCIIILLLQIVVKLEAYNLTTLLQIEPETDFWL